MECYSTREQASAYFKSQGFARSAVAVFLVLNVKEQKLGWYYNYLATHALSLKPGHLELLDGPPKGYKVIPQGKSFLFEKKLHVYADNSTSIGLIKDRKIIHGVKCPDKVLELSQLIGLNSTMKTSRCYLITEKETGKNLNAIWATGTPFSFNTCVFMLQDKIINLDPQKHSLELQTLDQEFMIDQQFYLVHTSKGLPCIREIDTKLRSRMKEIQGQPTKGGNRNTFANFPF